jgi:methionine-rich copper-binding protein CopC
MNTLKKWANVFVLIFVSLLAVNPASAHTEIDHTSPSAGDSVQAGVQTVSVVFTDKILNLANSSEILITDEAGQSVETSCIELKNTALSAEAFLGSAGNYKVTWRTVAEDGHAITGTFEFTVTGTADKANFVSCKDLAAQGGTVIAEPKPTKPQVEQTSSPFPILFYGAVFLLLVVMVGVEIRRRSAKG